jgi:hypothetical protein
MGALEFMPSNQAGLSPRDWPSLLAATMPHFYLYCINNPSEGTIAKRRSDATLVSYVTPPLDNAGLYGMLADLGEEIRQARTAAAAGADITPRLDAVAALAEQARSRPPPPAICQGRVGRWVATISDPQQRTEIVRARLSFDVDPVAFLGRHQAGEQQAGERVARARAHLESVAVPDGVLEETVALCVAAGATGHRAELVLTRAATAHASLRGGDRLERADLLEVALPALRHRVERNPFDEPADIDGPRPRLCRGRPAFWPRLPRLQTCPARSPTASRSSWRRRFGRTLSPCCGRPSNRRPTAYRNGKHPRDRRVNRRSLGS